MIDLHSHGTLLNIKIGILFLGIPVTVFGSILTDVHSNLAIGLPLLVLGCVMLIGAFVSIIQGVESE